MLGRGQGRSGTLSECGAGRDEGEKGEICRVCAGSGEKSFEAPASAQCRAGRALAASVKVAPPHHCVPRERRSR